MTEDRDLRDRLAVANRILANEDILGGFGHVSVRPEGAEELYIATYGSASLVEADDIVRMDLDGNVLTEGGAETYSETAIHRAIYRARDDVDAVVHHHAPPVMPFTFTDIEFNPVFHMAALFADGVPLFDDYDDERGRLVVGREESDRMAEVLGDRRAQLLEGHGANVTGTSLEEVVVASKYFVMNAEYQLEGERADDPRYYTGPEESVENMIDDVLLRPRTVQRMWNHLEGKLDDN